MTEMYETIRATTAVRQARQMINVRSEILKKAKGATLSDEDKTVFTNTKKNMDDVLAEALGFTESTPEAHAEVLETQQRLGDIDQKARDIFADHDVKANLLFVEQFTLEAQDQMGRAQVALTSKSDRVFRELYRNRYLPLACSVILAFLFGALALIFGFSFQRRLQRSIGGLLEATREATRGNLAVRAQIVTADEIGLLTHAFNRMTKSLEDSTVSRAYVENIIESMLDGVLVIENSGTITRANREIEKIFGYSRAELFGAPLGKILKSFQVRDGLANTEVEGVTKNGVYVPVFVSVAPLASKGPDSEFKVCVVKDITERKKYEEELSERNLELTHANRELEAFSYSVSHDLRAPLRGIDGFSQALLEDYGPRLDGEAKNYLERIRGGVQRMGQLIDDILNLAKISRATMFFKTVDLSGIAEGIAQDLKSREADRDVTFEIKPGIEAGADPVLMKSALENLIGNAWKYTSKRGGAVIEFGATELYGKRTYFVRDNGVGFDMAYADKIFAPFQRLHKQEDFPGTGVGLASVQRIIHRHGGTIWAEAEVGRGATFYFTL